MKINQVMKRTGLSRKAIYVYEERGFLAPSKGEQGYRDYSDEDVDRLLLIAKLRELDFSLEDIADILHRPEGIDISLQRHYKHLETEMQETVQKLSMLQTILYNLPPNGQLEDFVRAADVAVPEETARALAQHLKEEIPAGSARRLCMQMYEAFLDVPLDTPERWNAWYDLLEKTERVSDRLWEGFEHYYGSLTVQQRYEDYRLRRKLVVGYTQFTPADEEAKAQEILSQLRKLTEDPKYRQRWMAYYQAIADPALSSGGTGLDSTENFVLLSSVYHKYSSLFNKIMNELVYPSLFSQEGNELRGALERALRDCFDLSSHTMIYFDFFNNTLEKQFGD